MLIVLFNTASRSESEMIKLASLKQLFNWYLVGLHSKQDPKESPDCVTICKGSNLSGLGPTCQQSLGNSSTCIVSPVTDAKFVSV